MKDLTIFILCFLIFALSSCKTQKDIQYIDRVSYIDKIKIDSVYISKSDSVYIYKLNDTIYINKFRTEYKNKYTLIKDTVYKHDSILFEKKVIETVKVEKKLTPLQIFQIASGKLLFMLLGIGLIYLIVKYIIKTKLN